MALTSIGDLAQTLALRRQQTALKTGMQRLSTELTTGITADTAAYLKGDLSSLTGITTRLARIDAFRIGASEIGLATQAAQAAVSAIGDLSLALRDDLLGTTQIRGEEAISALGADARQRFASAIAALNVRVGDRVIFAGVTSDGAATISAEAILAELTTATAGATTAAQMASTISDWFDDPAGYATTAYLGGAARGPVQIAEGESLGFGTTANDPALREVLKGLAMAAMLDTGALSGDAEGRAALALAAGEQLTAAETGRAYLAASLGLAEARVEAATTRNQTERSALLVAQSTLLAVDPYEASARLDEAETQLNLLYALTARLSKLSLTDYL